LRRIVLSFLKGLTFDDRDGLPSRMFEISIVTQHRQLPNDIERYLSIWSDSVLLRLGVAILGCL
jgi:hypothetical protein